MTDRLGERGVEDVSEENKALVRRYLEAIDNNDADDWKVLDEFLALDFVSHGGLPPGFTPDREGVKQAAEVFRQATPGRHVVVDQIAEADRVVTRIRGYGRHIGDHLGVPASGNDVEVEGWRSTGFGTGGSSSTGRSSTRRRFFSRRAFFRR